MTDFITKIVKENGLEAKDYMLEITESAYTSDSKHIIEVVEKLRSLGHKIEMDDFGSGYSSLNMLTSMPIDALKMDKAFIRNIQPGNKEMELVNLVLKIAQTLGVPVIAEGVETEEECRLLKEAGCDIIQGYYFSKPLPPEDFSKYAGNDKGESK
jgi:EAL domain-containing protein (putative c-di-GMP-specific phosphodiesterase class I)